MQSTRSTDPYFYTYTDPPNDVPTGVHGEPLDVFTVMQLHAQQLASRVLALCGIDDDEIEETSENETNASQRPR